METTPQVLLVSTKMDKCRMPLLKESINDNIKLITNEDLIKMEKDYSLPANIEVGKIFIKNPYSEHPTYVSIEDNFEIMRAKQDRISTILQNLGAQKIAIRVDLSSVELKERKGTLKGKYKIIKAKLSAETKKTVIKYNSLLHIYDSKSDYNEEERRKLYNRAKEELDKYPSLKGDSQIQRWFECRNPNRPSNNQGGEIYKICLTSEVNEIMDIAASLTGKKIFQLDAKVKEIINTKTSFNLEYVIIWDEKNADYIMPQYKSICEEYKSIQNNG